MLTCVIFSPLFFLRLHEYASMIRTAIFTIMNETQVRSINPTAHLMSLYSYETDPKDNAPPNCFV